jgi:hypothetical protein
MVRKSRNPGFFKVPVLIRIEEFEEHRRYQSARDKFHPKENDVPFNADACFDRKFVQDMGHSLPNATNDPTNDHTQQHCTGKLTASCSEERIG